MAINSGLIRLEWKYQNMRGNDIYQIQIVFSLVENRRKRRDEMGMESGGFNYVCYIWFFGVFFFFEKNEIWSKYGKMLASVNSYGKDMTSVISFLYGYIFNKLK